MTTSARPYVHTQQLSSAYHSSENWAYNPDRYKVFYCVQPFSTAKKDKPYNIAVTDKPFSTAVMDQPSSTVVAGKSFSTAVTDKSYNSTVTSQRSNTAVMDRPSSTAVTDQPSSTVVAGKPYVTVMRGKTCIIVKAGKPYNSAAAGQPSNSDQRVTPQVTATRTRRITARKKLPLHCVLLYFAFAMIACGFFCFPFSIPAFIFLSKAFDDNEYKARCYRWLVCIFSTLSFASFYAFIFGASRYIFFTPTNSSGVGGDGL